MVFLKIAESQFTTQEIHSSEAALCDAVVRERFFKKVAELKKVAPKASDFLYFSCVMLHADTAALIDQKTGEPKLGVDGKPITAKWEKNTKTGSWKWVCSDKNTKAYKNNNGDIFPEEELKKAYRQWVEKPLCQDHKSNTVDGMRGLILDTYWDNKHKRVIGLCALDKKNYPDLARKVESGYATNVSMGVSVSNAICYDCGRVAKTEAEYCPCMRNKTTYGEINIGLSPIELSIVVTGADPGAKLRHIIASLNTYTSQKEARIEELQRAGCVTPCELDSLRVEIDAIRSQLNSTRQIQAMLDPSQGTNFRALLDVINSPGATQKIKDLASTELEKLLGGNLAPSDLAKLETPQAPPAAQAQQAIQTQQTAEDGKTVEKETEKAEDNPEGGVEPPYGLTGSSQAMTGGRGSATQDPESSGPPPWSCDGRETRLASSNLEAQITAVLKRLDSMQKDLQTMQAVSQQIPKEEKDMSDLKERAQARREELDKKAYHLGGGGVNDPQTYPKEDADTIRNTQDKQMVGEGMEPGNDGLAGNDLEIKKKLSRAELEERKMRRHALLSKEAETHTVKTPDGKDITLVKGADGTWAVAPAQKAEDEKGLETLAYYQGGQGVNEPQTYPKEDSDTIRNTQDKQMVGEGMEMGNDGLAGNDLEIKKKMLRAELSARFIKVYADQTKTQELRDKSRWEVYAGDKKLFAATGADIYETKDLADDRYWNHLKSEDYGKRILSEIRREGLNKTAYLLTGKTVTAEPMPPMPAAPEMPIPAELPVEPPKDEKPAEATKGRVEESLAEVEKTLGDLKEALKEEGVVGKDGKEELPPIEVGKTAADLSAALDDSGDELAILSEVLTKRIEAGMVTGAEMTELLKLAEESIEASAELRREASLILEAKGMPEGLKKALEEKEEKKEKKEEKEDKKDEKKEDKEDKKEKKDEKEDKKEDKKDKEDKEEKEDKEDKKEKKSEAELVLEKARKIRAEKRQQLVRLAIEDEKEQKFEQKEHEVREEIEDLLEELEDIDMQEMESDDAQYAEDDPLIAELLAELEGEKEAELPKPEEDKAALASRRAWREKVAVEVGAKYQLKLDPAVDMDTDMVPKAHPQKSTMLGGLDTKPSDEGACVEGIDDMKAKIMKQVANLPKVREAAAKIGDLLKAGKLTVADLSDDAKLKALAVDPEAAKYWKQFWGEGDQDAKQFGQDLVKEFAQKKAAAEAEGFRLKLRRATDLALDMQEKGLIVQGREAMNRQIDDILKFDNPAFEAFKRALDRTANMAKTAGKSEPALQVGLQGEQATGTFTGQLERLWAPKKR